MMTNSMRRSLKLMELSRFLRMYGMNHLDAELGSNLPLREEAVKLGLAADKEFPTLDSSAFDKFVQYHCMATL
uniref:Uncharacterized protein n=1 Tax=Vitis vinifera TaxID=29760 RepID=F6HXS9_VITVI